MNGRGIPGAHASSTSSDEQLGGAGRDHGYWADSFEPSTDWFSPVSPQQQTAVGLLDRESDAEITAEQPFAPISDRYPAQDHPSFPPGALEITPDDVLEALGPQADEMLATADIDVDELIRLINAETVVMPPLVLPDELGEPQAQPSPEVVEAITSWKQRFLKGAVAAVILTLTGSGGAAAAMDKSVTVEIDGKERQVNTYESTVGEVLEDEGISIGEHDALSPSPQSKVGHNDTITLDRGRLLKMTVDGEQREEWVRSVTVGQALRQLGVADDGAWVSSARSTAVPEQGMDLVVKTAKDITITDGAGEPRQLTTTAVTVDELVQEQNLQLGPEDHITPGGDQKITSGATVQIDRTGSTVINVTVPIEPPVKEIEDDSMLKGEEKVENPGTPGEKIVFTRVSTRNGEETGREAVGEKITKEPTEKVVRVGTKQPPNSAVWDKLVQCEAGGNWSINSGNGYYGGLQFDKSTWDAYGGDQYAAYPHQASREQQISVATKVRDARGGSYGAWPGCSSKLGLS
ncbi:transglycosylase family protein [Saccharopolyspora sp. 6V]|uniref:transglycosylase family protein n=1 Tax=unclassified Saccharopolyspora TaxID=2646250 RepID=UPI0035A8B0C7